MPWLRIHDGALRHPKIIGLSDKAFRLWVWGLSYAQEQLTDGFLVTPAIPRRLFRATDDLVRQRLWEPVEGGFSIHDYLEWNDSREVVLGKREGAKDRYRRWNDRRDNALDTTPNKRVFSSRETTLPARSGVVLLDQDLSKKENDPILERAGKLLEELYPLWYSKYRHGARLRLTVNSLAFDDAVAICRTWPDERIEKLARIVLTTDEEWISRTDRGFRVFATKATWADDRLRQVEQQA